MRLTIGFEGCVCSVFVLLFGGLRLPLTDPMTPLPSLSDDGVEDSDRGVCVPWMPRAVEQKDVVLLGLFLTREGHRVGVVLFSACGALGVGLVNRLCEVGDAEIWKGLWRGSALKLSSAATETLWELF